MRNRHVAAVIAIGMPLVWSASSEARFLQTDPVGYQDGINWYAYVRNDPLNRMDPSGMFANVKIWDNGKVEIVLPIHFNNQSADANAATAAARSIESKWTGRFGRFNVTTVVQSISSEQSSKCGCANIVTITDTPTGSTTTPSGNVVSNGGHSYVVGDYEGHWTTQDTKGKAIPIRGTDDKGISSKGEDTFSHEGGHLMNVPDEAGNQGQLMDKGAGRTVTESNIRSIVNSPGNTVVNCSKDPSQCH